jgi:6-phosphogluconolactonase
MPEPKIEVHANPAAVAEAAAGHIVAASSRRLEEGGPFTLCLAGGSTPKLLYELLATEPWRSKIDWATTLIFFGDERCVPPDHADSNYAMAKAALLDHVPLPGDNVYRMKGELPPSEAAVQYDAMLSDLWGDIDTGKGFDICLLGMGDDAHTASLFPHTAALDAPAGKLCVANHVPKLDVDRLTLTYEAINRSREVLFLVVGEKKAVALDQVLHGDGDPAEYPSMRIDPDIGTLRFLIDPPAAGMHADDAGDDGA